MEKRSLPHRKIIFVCVNQRPPGDRVCCAGGGGAELRTKLKAMVKERQLAHLIRVSQSGCMDRCEKGPNIMVFPDNVWYCGVQEADLETILEEVVNSLGTSANASSEKEAAP